jgi:hypothetical protein
MGRWRPAGRCATLEPVSLPHDPAIDDHSVLEPRAVAEWLDADLDWVLRAISDDGLPVLGYRSDGTPLLAVDEVRAWLRRPTAADDET